MPTLLTTQDFLYLALTVGVAILTTVFTIATIYLILVLKDIRKISNTAGDITQKFHSMILVPISMFTKITETAFPYIEEFVKKHTDKVKKKK